MLGVAKKIGLKVFITRKKNCNYVRGWVSTQLTVVFCEKYIYQVMLYTIS